MNEKWMSCGFSEWNYTDVSLFSFVPQEKILTVKLARLASYWREGSLQLEQLHRCSPERSEIFLADDI